MTLSKAERLDGLRSQIAELENRKPTARPRGNKKADTVDAFERIVRLVSTRDRSTAELRKRLKEEDFSEREIEDALERACSCNLVDDMRFADARIRYLVRSGKGMAGVRRDLAEFGIDLDNVSGWPFDYLDASSESELCRALDLLERKPSRSSNVLRGSYQKLIRSGYSSDIAMKAAFEMQARQSA